MSLGVGDAWLFRLGAQTAVRWTGTGSTAAGCNGDSSRDRGRDSTGQPRAVTPNRKGHRRPRGRVKFTAVPTIHQRRVGGEI